MKRCLVFPGSLSAPFLGRQDKHKVESIAVVVVVVAVVVSSRIKMYKTNEPWEMQRHSPRPQVADE